MIHSLSGGVLSASQIFTYLYVRFSDGNGGWYLSPLPVEVGKTVYAVYAKRIEEGVVEKTLCDTAANAPIPFSRIKEIDAIK